MGSVARHSTGPPVPITLLMTRLAAAAGLSAGLLLAQPCAANVSRIDTLQPELAALPPVQVAGHTGRWYERFHDDGLSTLALAAARRVPAPEAAEAEARVVRAYVVARAAAVRLALLAEDQATVLRLRELVSASAPLRSTATSIGQAESQLLGAKEQAAATQALWRDAVERLSALTGTPADLLQTQLGAATASPQLLVFDARRLTGLDASAVAWRQDPAVQALGRLADRASRAGQQAQAGEKALHAVLARGRQGAATEIEQITAYRQLLGINDQLMAASAELALAWVQVVQQQGAAAFAMEAGVVPLVATQTVP
jgi:hypothetical protein